MKYFCADVDLAEPTEALAVPAGHDGIGVVIRWRGRPIGFLLEAVAPGTHIPAGEVAARLAREAGTRLLAARLRPELSANGTAPAAAPSLTVAVCTHDRPEMVRRCLASLRRHLGAKPGVDLLVVDNAPSDEQTLRLVGEMAAVRYVQEPRPGLDFARNRAVAEAAGEWIAFLDDDVVIDRGWLEGFRDALIENPDAAGITGLVLPLELDTEAQILFERRGGFRRGFEKLRYAGEALPGLHWYPHGAGNFGAGANMAFRTAVLDELGGFDEALDTGAPLPGGGDLDIFYRVVRSGRPLVYEPRMLVFHEHRREYAKLRRQYWTWGTGFTAFVSKSYSADPTQRARFRQVMRWWFSYQLRQVARGAVRRSEVPVGLVLAELLGAGVGLFGTYTRSRRRSRRISELHA